MKLICFIIKLVKQKKKGNFANIFTRLNHLDEDIADSILFLEVANAWQYSRFMDTNHAILKVFLPQIAIEGHSHGLTLKKGFLTKMHVHGFFPGWAKGLIYIKNPFFNEHLTQNIVYKSMPENLFKDYN